MRSIRQRLLVGLLAGMATLWLAVGFAVYVTVRTTLTGKFDAELRAIASEVRHLLPEGLLLEEPAWSPYTLDFFRAGSGLYFEAWDEDLLFSDRSPNLGDTPLPLPAQFDEQPLFWNFTMPAGETVRAVAQQFSLAAAPGFGETGAGYVVNVVVARNRESLDRSLHLLVAAAGLVGVLIVPFSLLAVRVAVGRGLRPLDDLAAHVAAIDVTSLHERIPTAGLPAELLTVTQRLNELMQRLEEGIERERRLNADLAHELRTPVTELRTMAEVALAWPDRTDTGPYQEVLAVARQMQAVVDNMLLLARWDRGVERPATTVSDVQPLLERCWAPHVERAEQKRLQVTFELPAGLRLDTHPALFEQLLGNLLSNAVEYSPAGGALELRGESRNGKVRLTVSNTVVDLSEGDLPHLFERFWRRDAARQGNGHAGLGLPVALSCARALGLELSAEMEEDRRKVRFVISSQGYG